MDRFDIRIQARRSGKTPKLQQLFEEEVAKGEFKVIAMAVNHNCLKNFVREINKDAYLSNNYSELSFRSVGAEGIAHRLRGLKNIKIFFDEIYLMEDFEIEALARFVSENRNIELISYTSYRQ